MKKQLLLSGALLLSIGAFSQKQHHLFSGGTVVEDKRFLNSFAKTNMELNPTTSANKPIGPVNQEVSTPNGGSSNSTSAPILNNVWYRISGSGNVYGFLVSSSKPLNYQRILGCVSFVQRKSATYVVSPPADGNVGSIVTYWGTGDASCNSLSCWDSTLIYADATNQGRYPSGGIWNPFPGNQNTDPTKAYAVGSGPVTTGSGWVGSWYASKSLSLTPKNAAGPDEQFFANAAPFNSATSPSMNKHDFPRYGFNVCDNAVWVAGTKVNDVNGTTNPTYGIRGASLSKGSFNSGVMVWTPDSIIPPTELRTDGSKILSGEPFLKFTPNGQTGYCMFTGVRQGAAVGSSNRGMQPIVYKTTNGGTSWVLVNGINFDAVTPAITQIKNTMRDVGGVTGTITAPWFWGEGIDMTIDANNKLHIISTAIGHASSHVDSMNYLSTWNATENYHWPHVNTARPLIVDYYGDGGASPWTTLIIDSLDTEGPSSTSGEGGFANNNPWADPTPNNSVSSDSRLQITRSYDGEFLAYSWGESDTIITTNAAHWNEFPNIKVRGFRTCDGFLSTDGYNLTGGTGVLAAVKDKAYFHYMSGEMKAGASTVNSATFAIPFTVSNNPLTEGINPVSNYFAMSHVGFAFASGCTVSTSVNNANKTDASESTVFPNPTESSFNVRLNLSTANDIAISVYNALGQKVSEAKVNGNIGENNVPMNMNNVNAGVYFVKIKVGKTESTKKLVVQ